MSSRPASTRRFLVTFRPLCATAAGRSAVERHRSPPFVDASCRREPDLEADPPAITALSRGAMFAPRLRVGDHVAYVTTVGRYGAEREEHWRLVALLRVARRFETHADAAAWYRAERRALPRNLVVPGNAALAYGWTDGDDVSAAQARAAEKRWEAEHRRRAEEHCTVLACDVLFRELTDPPAVMREQWTAWHGSVPRTRTPPEIGERLWKRLEQHARGPAAKKRPS